MNWLEDCATTQLAVCTVEWMHGLDDRDIRTIEFYPGKCQESRRIDPKSMITGDRTSW
jgi:hypothetical protein